MNINRIGIDEAGRGPWAGPLVVAGIATLDENIFSEIPFLNDSKKISEKQREKIYFQLLEIEKMGKIKIGISIQEASKIDEIGIKKANQNAMQEIIFSLLEKNCQNIIKIDGSDNFVFLENMPGKSKIFFEYFFASKKNQKFSQLDDKDKKIIQLFGKNFYKDFPKYQPFLNHVSLKEAYKNIIGKHQKFFKNLGGKNFASIGQVGIFCEFFSQNEIHFLIGGDASEKIISAASVVAKYSRDMIMKRFSQDFPEYEFDKNKGYGTKKHHDAILNYGINFLHRKTYEPIKTLISAQKSV